MPGTYILVNDGAWMATELNLPEGTWTNPDNEFCATATSWALLLPLGSAAVRGVVPPIAKLGLEIWPSPLWACLIGYIMSSLVVLTVQRVRKGSFAVQAPRSGRFWFALTGISNGLSALTLFAAVRNGPITLVAPLVAIYPLVTVGLSAMMLKHVAITPRIIVGTLLTVAGVALVLAG